MRSIKALFVALLPLVPAVALSQTPIIASNVSAGAGGVLSSGSWCINSTCFAVAEGVIQAGASVPTTIGTVTITCACGYSSGPSTSPDPEVRSMISAVYTATTVAYLSMPNVSISGSNPFSWDTYVQTVANGT